MKVARGAAITFSSESDIGGGCSGLSTYQKGAWGYSTREFGLKLLVVKDFSVECGWMIREYRFFGVRLS